MTGVADIVLKDVFFDGGIADISIENGYVCHTGSPMRADKTINCAGMYVMPAAVDIHVHIRGGNSQAYKENWKTGTKSAVAGGVTVVVDQPNTVPGITNAEIFEKRVEEAKKDTFCHFAVNGGVTTDARLKEMWKAGANIFGETFAGPSSYGEAVSPEDLTKALEVVKSLDATASIHAEIVKEGNDTDLMMHNSLRSVSDEVKAIKMVQNCNKADCKLHFCHMSSAAAVNAVKSGTIEVTPHHLLLSIENSEPDDTKLRVNPPVRTEYERKKLWSQLERVDVIASDHAPHSQKDKSKPFSEAPSGIPGVETMVPLLMAKVVNGELSVTDLIQKTSTNPSKIMGITPAGFKTGERADFAIYKKETTQVNADLLHSKAGWTPYEGFSAVFPETVIMAGDIIYSEMEFFRGNAQWLPGRGYEGKRIYSK